MYDLSSTVTKHLTNKRPLDLVARKKFPARFKILSTLVADGSLLVAYEETESTQVKFQALPNYGLEEDLINSIPPDQWGTGNHPGLGQFGTAAVSDDTYYYSSRSNGRIYHQKLVTSPKGITFANTATSSVKPSYTHRGLKDSPPELVPDDAGSIYYSYKDSSGRVTGGNLTELNGQRDIVKILPISSNMTHNLISEEGRTGVLTVRRGEIYNSTLTTVKPSDLNPALNQVSNMYLNGTTLLVAFMSGDIYKYSYSLTSHTISSPQYLLTVPGQVKHMTSTKDYMVIANEYDDLYILNLKTSEVVVKTMRGNIRDVYLDDIFLIVGYESTVEYFSMIDQVPTVEFITTKLERIYQPTTDRFSYYINLQARLLDSSPHSHRDVDIDVSLDFPDFAPVKFNFSETNNPQNVYIPMRTKSGQEIIDRDLQYRNKFDIKPYTDIFTYKEDGTSRTTNTSTIKVVDKTRDLNLIYNDPILHPDFRMNITQVDINDLYLYKKDLYLSTRLLSTTPTDFFFFGYQAKNGRKISTIFFLDEDLPVSRDKIYDLVVRTKFPALKLSDTKYSTSEGIPWNSDGEIKYLDTKRVDRDMYVELKVTNLVDDYSYLQSESFFKSLYFTKGRIEDNSLVFQDITPSMIGTPTSMGDQQIKVRDGYRTTRTTSRGNLRTFKDTLVEDVTKGSKANFMRNISNISYESTIPTSKLTMTTRDTILNGQSIPGYLALPVEYDGTRSASKLQVPELYIGGKRLYNKFTKVRDRFDGVVTAYYPTTTLGDLGTAEDRNLIAANKLPKSSIIATLRSRDLNTSEEILGSHTVTDAYQDEINLLQTKGIYIPIQVHDHMSTDRIRVFIRKSQQTTYTRINPRDYTLDLDREYNQVLLRILGGTWLELGTEILLVTNGVTDKTIFYDKLDDSYQLDSVPLLQTSNGKYLMITGKRPDDVDVNLNGYTLIPHVDYTILDSTTSQGDPISLLIFRNSLGKEAILEINFLDDNTYQTRFFPEPAVGTSDIIKLEDNDLFFYENFFEVFVNNLKIPKNQITILDSKTIKVNGVSGKFVNIMLRFSYDPNPNLADIFSYYKIPNIKSNLPYYQSRKLGYRIDSNFDRLTYTSNSSSLGKFFIKDKLDSLERGDITASDVAKFDMNRFLDRKTDLYLDSRLSDSQYITENLFIRSNLNYE